MEPTDFRQIYVYKYISMKPLIELISAPNLPVNFTDQVRDKICERMKTLGLDKGHFKLDLKVLLWVCVCCESLTEKGMKVNKKELVLDVFRHTFGVSEDDVRVLSNNIDILHACKKIKRKSYFRCFLTSIREALTL